MKRKIGKKSLFWSKKSSLFFEKSTRFPLQFFLFLLFRRNKKRFSLQSGLELRFVFLIKNDNLLQSLRKALEIFFSNFPIFCQNFSCFFKITPAYEKKVILGDRKHGDVIHVFVFNIAGNFPGSEFCFCKFYLIKIRGLEDGN